MLIKPIKKAIRVISNPKKEFQEINRMTFEFIAKDYMLLLVFSALAAGLFNFLFSFLKALYFDIFVDIDIQYWRMINYTISSSISITFFYIFAGTFLLFFLSILLKAFLRNIKYTRLLEILFYSLSPLLLFGWIPSYPPLAIWSIFLFIAGIKYNKNIMIKKDSVHNRS